jgi:drug/metabolite transporter (DMT)-like permease
MKPGYLIILLVMNFFWAAVYAAYKIIGQELPAAGLTGGIVTLRFGLAGLCLLLVWPWVPGPAPRGADLARTCVMGLLLYVVGQRLQVYGNETGTAGNSAVVMALEPLITSLAAMMFLREPIGPRRMAGFGLGIVGVALLNGLWRPDFRWAGMSASLIFASSFICEAAYSVVGKPIVTRASPIKMLAISILVGTAANLIIDGRTTMAAAGALSFKAWALLVAMAIICTAVGYTLWFVIIRDCPVNLAALTIFSQSVFGVAIAGFWLKEKLSWDQLWGSATILLGLAIGFSRQIKKINPKPQNQL